MLASTFPHKLTLWREEAQSLNHWNKTLGAGGTFCKDWRTWVVSSVSRAAERCVEKHREKACELGLWGGQPCAERDDGRLRASHHQRQ